MKLIESKQPGKNQGYIKTMSVVVNPQDNGGESITLSVDVYDNGDGIPEGMFTEVMLETNCYGTSSTRVSLWSGIESLAEAVNLLKNNLPS